MKRRPPMTLPEAARHFRIPLGSLRRLLAEGHLRSVNGKRPHTVNPWDVQDWIDTERRKTRRVIGHLTRSSVGCGRLAESVGDHHPDDTHIHGDACEDPGCSD